MSRKLLVADLLCGAGGSSTGCIRALQDLGWSPDDIVLTCVNHWPTAIETHRLNHPEARHYVQDIATVRPSAIVPEGYLDLLMASPTCTHHSVARGGKPTSDQQRSDPWHIITWLTELRVKRLIIENVWEFTGWGPVDVRTGRPIASRKGEYFHAWIETLKRLGFEPEWRKLNAADYGDATTRQRFILMARSDGRRVHWPMPTHCRRDKLSTELFTTQKPWRAAREIIDLSIKGRSIFNRKKDLAPKTFARIYAGAVKFGWPEAYLVILRNHMAARGLDLPLPTIAANGNHIGIAQPVIMNGRKGNKPLGISESPLPTLDTKGGVWPAEPLILSQHNSGAARTVGDPLPTITTGGAATEGHPGCARPMMVEPFILNRHGDNGGTRAHPLDEPAPTANCDGGGYLVEPFVLSQASGGAPRAASEPLPTICTGGQRGSGTALISPYYGGGSGETCTSANEPLPTVTSKGRFGLVVPVTHSKGSNAARDVEEPIPTLTTAKGGEFAVVMPVTHHDGSDRMRDASDPLPTITGANRGELAFITAQHGERPGQPPRVHASTIRRPPLPPVVMSTWSSQGRNTTSFFACWNRTSSPLPWALRPRITNTSSPAPRRNRSSRSATPFRSPRCAPASAPSWPTQHQSNPSNRQCRRQRNNMADRTTIEWSDATWNPIAGCTRVSEACRNCYATPIAARFQNNPAFAGIAHYVDRPDGTREARWTGAVTVREHLMDLPLRWRRPRRIFVNSMSDLFHDAVPDEVIDRIFAVMALSPQHTFQILTKRPERMRAYLSKPHHHGKSITVTDDGRAFDTPAARFRVHAAMCDRLGKTPASALNLASEWLDAHYPDGDGFIRRWPLPNVWLGVSVEDQVTADVRVPYLLDTPAAIRFASYEPALGPIDWTNLDNTGTCRAEDRHGIDAFWKTSLRPRLDLIIMGGESGPNARPMHPGWARQTRDQCAAAGVPFFFKQWGEWSPSTKEEAAGNPHSGWRCLAGHPHVARAEELYPENGAAFIERKGKRAAGRLLDGVEHNGMPEVRHA